jgi:hypothetical protein
MPYSIQTKDGIKINNIPDDIDPQSEQLRARVLEIRSKQGGQVPTAQAEEAVPVVQDQSGITPAPIPNPQLTHPLAKDIEAGGGVLGDFGKGFERGIAELSGGLAQRGFEISEKRQSERLTEFAKKINSGEIPASEENLAKFDSMSSMLMRTREGLTGGQEVEKEMRQAFDSAVDRSPVKSIAGNIAGQVTTGAMLTPALPGALPASLGGKTLMGAGVGAIGGAVQPTVDDESVLGNTVAGGTVGAILPVAIQKAIIPAIKAPKGIYDAFSDYVSKRKSIKNILESATPNTIVDEAEAIVRTGGENAQSKLDQLMLTHDAMTSPHPTLRLIHDTIQDGGTVDDVAKVISDQKDVASKGVAAKYRLEGAKLEKSETAQELIRQGADKNDVQMVASASDPDKEVFKKILSRVKSGMESSRVKNKLHPQAVIGDSLLERLNYVKDVNKKAGEKISVIANKELKNKTVSLNDPFTKFKDSLDELGVRFDNGKIDFEGSALMDLPKLQKPIINIMNRIDPSRNQKVSAYDAHILKKWFDFNINYGKTPTGGGMEPQVESAIRGFRAGINDELGKISKNYKEANTRYADTIGAINDLKSRAGKTRDLAGDYADETLGMLAKRVTSNAISRGQVRESFEALENVSAKYGKIFKDDIASQVQFVNLLEKKLGAFADNSLMGQVQAPTMRAAERVMSGKIPGLGDAIDAAKAIKQKISPIDEEAYIKALEDLINGK